MIKFLFIAAAIYFIWKIFKSTLTGLIKVLLIIVGIAFVLSLMSCTNEQRTPETIVKERIKEEVEIQLDTIKKDTSKTIKEKANVAGKTTGKYLKKGLDISKSFYDGVKQEVTKK